MEEDFSHNRKGENSKMGPKLERNVQCKKQVQQNSTLSMLATSKIEQADNIKEKKILKTFKDLSLGTIESTHCSGNTIKPESITNIHKIDDLIYEESIEHDMESECDDDSGILRDNMTSQMPQNRNIYDESNRVHIPDRQLRYDHFYKEEEDKNLLSDEVDLKESLKRHSISPFLRTKMVDWMIEVFANYKPASTDKTYFRAVYILDLFHKKCNRVLKESDVHLYGISAMFLASKLEDITHISLDDIVEKVGHNKFTERKIREGEFEILRTIDMMIDMPTPYTHLMRYIFKTFSSNQNNTVNYIHLTAVYLLKMCLHDIDFLEYKSHTLAFSVLIISLKFYFQSMRSEGLNKNQLSQFEKQEIAVIDQMFKQVQPEEHKTLWTCTTAIKDLFNQFKTRYPEIKNIDKYSS